MSNSRFLSRVGLASVLTLPADLADSSDTLLDTLLDPAFPEGVSALIIDGRSVEKFNCTSVGFLAPFVLKGSSVGVPIYLVGFSERNQRVLAMSTIAPPRVRVVLTLEEALGDLGEARR